MDNLACEGVLFEQMYVQAFWTRPSVASFMTAQLFPSDCLTSSVRAEEVVLHPRKGEVLLPAVLSANGYATAMVSAHGGYITQHSRLARAFDEFYLVAPSQRLETSTNEAYASFEKVNGVVLPWLSQKRNRPFFLYIHAMDTHFPHRPEKEPFTQWLDPLYSGRAVRNGQPVAKPGTPSAPGTYGQADKDYLRSLYDGGILYADTCVGAILDLLKSLGLSNNTLIIIGSDHGELLGENGNYWGHGDEMPTREVQRVPWIMAGPGLPRGVRIRSLTQTIDVFPTLVQLLGLTTDAELHGKSLAPLLRGSEGRPLDRYVVARTRYEGRGTPTLFLEDDKFKYEWSLRTNEEHLWQVPDNVEDRLDVIRDSPAVAAQMKEYLRIHVVPLWKQAEEEPGAIMLTLSYLPSELSPASSFVQGDKAPEGYDLHRDGKWWYDKSQLWSRGPDEDSPPVTIRWPVRNGRYRAQVELLSQRDHSNTGIPASSVLIKAQSDKEFKTVTDDSCDPARRVFVDFGVYEVTKGVFEVTLDDVRSHFVFLRHFRLISDEDGVEEALKRYEEALPTPEEMKENEQRLRALGYVK